MVGSLADPRFVYFSSTSIFSTKLTQVTVMRLFFSDSCYIILWCAHTLNYIYLYTVRLFKGLGTT